MQPNVLKYILDIESIITEIEAIIIKSDNDFSVFSTDIILQRAIERDLEIVGEALKKIKQIIPNIPISSSKNIIGLRNLISHAYDSIEPALIWGIIQKDIPVLKKEIFLFKNR